MGILAGRGVGHATDLARTVGDEAKVFAEAEGADALFEGSTAAAEKTLKQSFQAEPAGDAGFNFGEFLCGEFFPARADGSVVAQAAEEELDFGKGKIHFSREANEEYAVEGVGGIAALAAGAMRRSEQAEFFVVADGGGVDAGALGEFADFHGAPSLDRGIWLVLTRCNQSKRDSSRKNRAMPKSTSTAQADTSQERSASKNRRPASHDKAARFGHPKRTGQASAKA